MRLRYGGSAARWGFAIYLASKDGYEVSALPTGVFAGAPRRCPGHRLRGGITLSRGDGADTLVQLSDQRMLIARAITRAARARDTIDSEITISLAQTRTADTSVGLKARAVLNDKAR